MRRIFIVCALVFAFLLMAQAETLAQEIYGCVNKRTGALRIVDSLALCTAKETQLTLNQGGTQGFKGPAGPAGIACWDLNKNGSCDVADEDVNGDKACDTSDCQGSPGVGNLGVYDGNNIFLGYLVDVHDNGFWRVYDLNTSDWFFVFNHPLPYIQYLPVETEVFTTADCSEQAHGVVGPTFQLLRRSSTNKYFIVDPSVAPVLGTATVAAIEYRGTGIYIPGYLP